MLKGQLLQQKAEFIFEKMMRKTYFFLANQTCHIKPINKLHVEGKKLFIMWLIVILRASRKNDKLQCEQQCAITKKNVENQIKSKWIKLDSIEKKQKETC